MRPQQAHYNVSVMSNSLLFSIGNDLLIIHDHHNHILKCD